MGVVIYFVYFSVCFKYFERNKGRKKERKKDFENAGCRMLDRNNAELNS